MKPPKSGSQHQGGPGEKEALGKLHLPILHGDYRPSLLSEL